MSPQDRDEDPEGTTNADADQARRRLVEMLDEAPEASAAGGEGGHGGSRAFARLARLCELSVSEVGVDGAGITAMGSVEGGLQGARDQVAATGQCARRLEELQLTLGEGPCLDAYRDGLPVLITDLAAEPSRWLGFGPEASRVGVTALFSFPLQVGAVRLGTLDLYRGIAGPLSHAQLATALILTSLATENLLHLVDAEFADHPADAMSGMPPGWLPDVHADVHVAAGMLSVRWKIGVAAALVRLRAHAFTRGEPLHDLARRIVSRDLVLDHPVQGAPDPDTDLSDWPPAPDPENGDS